MTPVVALPPAAVTGGAAAPLKPLYGAKAGGAGAGKPGGGGALGCVVTLHTSLDWDELEWGDSGVSVRGVHYPLRCMRTLERVHPSVALPMLAPKPPLPPGRRCAELLPEGAGGASAGTPAPPGLKQAIAGLFASGRWPVSDTTLPPLWDASGARVRGVLVKRGGILRRRLFGKAAFARAKQASKPKPK